MSLGRRKGENQEELFVMHNRLPKSPGHVFERKMNQLASFDRWVEPLCEPFYANDRGGRLFRRESIPACSWSDLDFPKKR